jgi:hypothetical protein
MELVFREYDKVRRLGAIETEGILEGKNLYVFEKLDGAQTNIQKTEDGQLILGSRTRIIPAGDKQFSGFVEWANSHALLRSVPPGIILYGEYLTHHSTSYSPEYYNRFYLYDAWGQEGYRSHEEVVELASKLCLACLSPFYIGPYISEEHLLSFVGRSDFGAQPGGEGIVIKRYDGWRNRFGRTQWAKIVADRCAEDKSSAAGTQRAKKSHEAKIAERFTTPARIRKAYEVGAQQGHVDTGDLRVMQWLPNLVYADVLSEEILAIAKACPALDFGVLRREVVRKVANILKAS